MGQGASIASSPPSTPSSVERTEAERKERERLTMCRGRLRDSFRERCQRMQLTRARFGASLRQRVPGGRGRR
jgi:hypothetical protein